LKALRLIERQILIGKVETGFDKSECEEIISNPDIAVAEEILNLGKKSDLF